MWGQLCHPRVCHSTVDKSSASRMLLAELRPAAAAEPASPCLGSWQDSVAQEPFDFLASLLSGEDPCQSPEPLAWDPDKSLESPQLEEGQNRLQHPFAETFPQNRTPLDTGMQSHPSSLLSARPVLQGGISPAPRTAALHPFSQVQPRQHSDGLNLRCASQAAHEPTSLSQDTFASLPATQPHDEGFLQPMQPIRTSPAAISASALAMQEILQPMQPARTPTSFAGASALPVQGSIPADVLEQLAVGRELLMRGMHQLPGSANIPVPRAPVSQMSDRHEPSSFPMSAVQPEQCAASFNSDLSRQQRPVAHNTKPSRKRLRLEPEPHLQEPVSPSPGRPFLSHQHRDIAASLTDVAASAHSSPESRGSRIDALQGLACARGLPTREIIDLKRRNLQVVKPRGEWRSHYALPGGSLLDIYDAFGRGDMGFSIPLMLNGQQQDIKLGFIVQQDIASLYMQAVGGLNRYAAQASLPQGHDSELFTKGVCQSLVLVTCIFETPRHLMRLFTEYLCKSQSDPRSHTNGPAHTAFLEQQLGQEWKQSITAAQRDQVRSALRTHREAVSELTSMRAEALEQMNHDLEAELQGSLDPERIKQLSDKAHSLSVILGLAQETRLQLARKVIYEILSPWQWGHISACFHPIMPDIVLCSKYIAGDEPLVPLPALSSMQCYAYSALTVREQAIAPEGEPATSEGKGIYDRIYRAL